VPATQPAVLRSTVQYSSISLPSSRLKRDSLAAPIRKLGLFPRGVVQMIEVGEESGRLDEMLLKVADVEERHMRARTRTVISLLAPVLILVVGAIVGFIVIALLLPIFRMSSAIQ